MHICVCMHVCMFVCVHICVCMRVPISISTLMVDCNNDVAAGVRDDDDDDDDDNDFNCKLINIKITNKCKYVR